MTYSPKKCNSVSDFADNYDAFILDIWGVIHDGGATYPGVVECMKSLHAAGKQIIFLSNAPRRASKVMDVLGKFGITRDLYHGAISSGEAAYDIIGSQEKDGAKFVYIGPEKDRDLLNGLNLQEVESAAEADFCVATGFDNDASTLEEKLPQIQDCMDAKLKMYCVNPDLLVVRQDGTRMLCAGVIGEYYRDKGFETEFIGKPHGQVYEQCFKLLQGVAKDKICAVGDNLDTDILGGNAIGIDTALCLGGVLLGAEKPVEELAKEVGANPAYTIPSFNF